MVTDDEGRICSACGVYIPITSSALFQKGNRVLCMDCGQKDPQPDDIWMAGRPEKSAPAYQIPLPTVQTGLNWWRLTPLEQDIHFTATGLLYLLGVIAIVVGGVAASEGAGAWGFVAGLVSACTFFWFGFVLRLLRVAVREIAEIRSILDRQKPPDPK